LAKVKTTDVVPRSLGLEVTDTETGVVSMNVVIPRNTPLPATFTKTYTTVDNYIPTIRFTIRQGDEPLAEDNQELAKMRINKIPPLPAGEPIVEVTFDVDVDGILSVTGKLQGDDTNVVTIDKINGGMKPDAIAQAKKKTLKDYYIDFVQNMKDIVADDAKKKLLAEADITSLEVCIE